MTRCLDCPSDATPFRRCAPCRARIAYGNRKWRAKVYPARKEAGLCVVCGKVPAAGVRCDECWQAEKLGRADRADAMEATQRAPTRTIATSPGPSGGAGRGRAVGASCGKAETAAECEAVHAG